MMTKEQIKDSEKCEQMQEQGEDMDCFGCSCNVCIAQEDTGADKKLQKIKEYIDKRIKALTETRKLNDAICVFLLTELETIKHNLIN